MDKKVQTEIVANFGGAPIPAYVPLSEEAAYYWPLYTFGRPRDEWLPAEMLTVAKICEFENDLQKYRAAIAEQGVLIPDRFDGVKLNPVIAAINNAARMQLKLMQCLSMMLTPVDRKGADLKSKRAAQSLELAESEVGDYLEISYKTPEPRG